MASNFLQKDRSTVAAPANYLTGGGDDVYEQQRKKLIPIVPEDDAGFVPVDINGGQQTPATEPTKQPNVPVFNNGPSPTDDLSAMINSPLANLPSFKRAMEARQKRIALEAMPTYVNKKGETVQGMEDKDGRLQSGLKGLVQGLVENFGSGRQIRDYGDLLAGVTGTIVRGAGGAIVPSWNEYADRDREIARLKSEEADAVKGVEFESKMMTAAVTRETKQADAVRKDKTLDNRIARNKIQNLKDTQKMALEPIFKRGYYYEGDNPQEDAALAAANVILPDFDNSRKPIVDNGVKKAWNPETRAYEPMQGSEADPDDAPMTFVVDGEKITASSKYFLNYKAGVERQKSQQAFQAGENDKNRAVQWARIKQAAEQFKAKTANEVVARRAAIQKALETGDIQQAEADELLEILKRNNPDFQ